MTRPTDRFSDLFRKSAFCNYSPETNQLVVIDPKKGFKPYASFFKRPLPAIHRDSHCIGTLTAMPATSSRRPNKVAIALRKTNVEYCLDAPFGKLDVEDKTADLLRYQFLQSVSLAGGILHMKKKKSAEFLSFSTALLSQPPSILLSEETSLKKKVTEQAAKSWEELQSQCNTREDLFKLLVSEKEKFSHYSIPQLKKTLRGPIIFGEKKNELQVRGRILGYASGSSGFAVAVSGWIAFLPHSLIHQFPPSLTMTATTFISKMKGQTIDVFRVKSCMIDTETGNPLIVLALEDAEVERLASLYFTAKSDEVNI